MIEFRRRKTPSKCENWHRESVVTTWRVRGKQFQPLIYISNELGKYRDGVSNGWLKLSRALFIISYTNLFCKLWSTNFRNWFNSGGLSNFLYYVSLPDDIDSCNNVKNIKRARKDASPQEPKEVGVIWSFYFFIHHVSYISITPNPTKTHSNPFRL